MAAVALALAACVTSSATPPATTPAAGAAFTAVGAQAAPDGRGAVVTFQEKGLPAGGSVTLVASAQATATYLCADAAGNALPPVIPLTAQVSAVGHLRAASDGTINGALTLHPPPGESVPCGPPLKPAIRSASYSEIALSDVTDRIQVSVPGTIDSLRR